MKARRLLSAITQLRAFGTHAGAELLGYPRELVTFYVNYYANTKGALNSYVHKKPVTLENTEIPWYTFAAIEYLDQLDISKSKVLEFGSGNSSVYLSARSLSVTSMEADRDWYEIGKRRIIDKNELRYAETVEDYTLRNLGIADYDVIVIDGHFRFDCAVRTIEGCRSDALIVFDNSDWYPNSLQLFLDAGFTRIDFIGPGPINCYPWCTSILFRTPPPLRYKNSRPLVAMGLQNWRLNKYDSHFVE